MPRDTSRHTARRTVKTEMTGRVPASPSRSNIAPPPVLRDLDRRMGKPPTTTAVSKLSEPPRATAPPKHRR